MSGMMPLGAAGMAGARASASGAHQVPDYLVTVDNGERLVGGGPLVGPSVVDAVSPDDAAGATPQGADLRVGP